MYLKTSSGYRTPETESNGHAVEPDTTCTPNIDTAPPPSQSVLCTTEGMGADQSWRTNPDKRVRRASRAQEHSTLHRARSAAECDSVIATSQRGWLKAVDQAIVDQDLRADGQRNRRAIARIIGLNAHWQTLTTTTLTWGRICTLTGLSRRCIAKHLLALWMTGWIGRVATGRSAYAKQAAGWTGEQATVNDAPVYALIEPAQVEYVDTKCTPPTSSGNISSPAHARGNHPECAASRHSPLKAGKPRHELVPADRGHTAFSAYTTTTSKDERVRAAATWARLVPALRKLSARHLASIARPFLIAGWTVKDLIHACDHLSDGRAQGQFVDGRWVAYSGADGIPRSRLGHWLKWRLGHWTTETGAVEESPTQRATRKAEAARRREAAILQADSELRKANRAAMDDPAAQSTKRKCLEQMQNRSKAARLKRIRR